MTKVLNARILAGLGMIVFAAALIVGGTGAFFSDTETSTGNTFTAGALDLKIDSVAHYNGMVCTASGETHVWVPDASVTYDEFLQPILGEDMDTQEEWDAYNIAHPLQYPEAGTPCTGTWPLADLGEGKLAVGTFFDFDDIKPGDEGENTISIHVDNNDAWMCVSLDNTAEADNGQNEPELEAGDDANDAIGELDENLWFFAWGDDGDNVFEENETAFGDPVAASTLVDQTWALADSTTGNGPIQGGSTSFIGLYWCAGAITVDGNDLSCDGAAMGNIAQTDSWSADLQFYIEQARNNEDFRCTPPTTEPETATLTVDKSLVFTDIGITDVDVSDFTLHITNGADINMNVTDNVPVPGLPAGTYTVSETYTGGQLLNIDAQFGGACSDDGNTGSVTLADGDVLVCEIENHLSFID